MRKIMMIVVQVLIFVGAWFVMSPDVLEDNTHLFGLIGDIEVIKGNTDWVMLCSALLSALNILIWWPKSPTHKTVGDNANTKSAETNKAKDQDPVVPKMD